MIYLGDLEMKKLLILFLATLLSATGGNLLAFQTFTDPAEFDAAINAETCLPVDLSEFSDIPTGESEIAPAEITQPFGTFTFGESGFLQGTLPLPVIGSATNPDTGEFAGVVIVPGQFSLNANIDPANGLFAGFCLQYTSAFDTNINIFDADDNVIDTFVLDALPSTNETAFFCWINCDEIEVSRIEVTSDTDVIFAILDGNFCFDPIVEEEPTARGCVEDVIDSIDAILAGASETDQAFLNAALYNLSCSLNPDFWATDDRLSNYGDGFFSNVFDAVYFLGCVSDPALVEDIQIAIQDCLSLVVDNEIAFALENPYVDNNLVYYSEFFGSYADAYADAGFYLEAVLLQFYAWLFALFA